MADKFDKLKAVQQDLIELDVKLQDTNLLEWIQNGLPIRSDNLVNRLFVHRIAKGKDTISKDVLITIISDMETQHRETMFREFQDKIAYKAGLPDKFTELAQFISKDNYDTIYPVVLRHMVWTVKRRLFRLEDYCPIFISVYGSAGSGKSEFVNSLFTIFPHTLKTRVSNANELFNDERQTFRFVENYVLIMDELTGIGKTDINKLKNQIDCRKIVYRQLGFNKTSEGNNNAQLVGTSNTRLRNTINTDTDIRKWCEIDFYSYPHNEVPEKMVKPLHAFDWLTLWQSVDENGKSPFHDSAVYNEFVEWTSKKCQHESAHLMYLQKVIDNHGGEWISKESIYDIGYKREVAEHQLNWGNFKEKAEKLGFVIKKKTAGIGLVVPGTLPVQPIEDTAFDIPDRRANNLITRLTGGVNQ